MNDFTIGLNFPPDRNNYVMESIFTDGDEVSWSGRFEPFGIRAYMCHPTVFRGTLQPVSLNHGDMMLFLVGRIFNLDDLWNSYNPDRAKNGNNSTSASADSTATAAATETSKLVLLFKLYRTYGIDYLLQLLDGVFTMVLVDQRVDQEQTRMYVVSDSMGALPLYVSVHYQSEGDMYIFSTQRMVGLGENTAIMPMGTYQMYTLPHIIRAKWVLSDTHQYHHLGRSGGFPVLPDPATGGITNNERDTIRNMLLYRLQVGIEKRLASQPELTQVICMGLAELPDDPEFYLLCRVLTDICTRRNLILTCHIPVPTVVRPGDSPLGDTDHWARLTRELCDCTQGTTQVFMSSFIMNNEKAIVSYVSQQKDREYSHPSIQYDYEFRNEVEHLAERQLIPYIVEPMKRHDILVEFPLLEASWLDLYLSLGAKFRFDCTMETLLTVDAAL